MAQTAELLRLKMLEQILAREGVGRLGRREPVNGTARPQPAASYTHSLIQATLALVIGSHLVARKSDYRVGVQAPVAPPFGSSASTRMPDLSVSCLPVGDGLVSPDPVLIVEIVSRTNRDAVWESIRSCANIARVREILVVESERIGAQVFRRSELGDWSAQGRALAVGDDIALATIDLAFPLIAAYAGTPLG
jgi:Uma2 family endonuclease